MLKQDSIFVIAVRTGPVVQSYRWHKWRRGERDEEFYIHIIDKNKNEAGCSYTWYHLPSTLYLVPSARTLNTFTVSFCLGAHLYRTTVWWI